MNSRTSKAFLAFLVASATLPPFALAQQEGEDIRAGALSVYLECAARGCESSHYRTEITFVNWVQEVQDSDLHVIMTSSSTGSGDVYLLDFIGRGELEGSNDQLTYSHSDADTDFERSQGLTGVLAVGLARYAVMSGQDGPFLVNTGGERRQGRPQLPPGLQGEVDDPWDYWVFEVGGNIRLEEEDNDKSKRYSGDFSANRTTEMWKISVSGRGSYSLREVVLSSGDIYKDERDDWSTDTRIYYSLAERWSAGIDAGASSSTRNNQKLGARFGSGVEYSFYPYRDWTRQRMTMQALVYSRYYDYEETTIYGKDTETVWEGSLRWGVGFRQPWGTANLNATAEAFLHDPKEFHRLSIGGRISVRIFRGLDWNLGGEIEKIRDQIYLSGEGLSDEEILVSRRQLPTSKSWNISTGFSFRFGSIYNNIVNNRFGFIGGGGRGMDFSRFF
jgi:hypothetical protein